MTRWSKSSPPRKVSPAVLMTLNTPELEISRIEMSNVPPPKVEDGHRAIDVLAEAVGERRGGRLVDDSNDVEPSDRARVLRGLALIVVEVRRNGDDDLVHLFTEVVFGHHLHLLEHHRADLRDRVDLVTHLDAGIAVRALDDVERAGLDRVLHLRAFPLAADQPLGCEHGVFRVGDGLPLRDVADQVFFHLRSPQPSRG